MCMLANRIFYSRAHFCMWLTAFHCCGGHCGCCVAAVTVATVTCLSVHRLQLFTCRSLRSTAKRILQWRLLLLLQFNKFLLLLLLSRHNFIKKIRIILFIFRYLFFFCSICSLFVYFLVWLFLSIIPDPSHCFKCFQYCLLSWHLLQLFYFLLLLTFVIIIIVIFQIPLLGTVSSWKRTTLFLCFQVFGWKFELTCERNTRTKAMNIMCVYIHCFVQMIS